MQSKIIQKSRSSKFFSRMLNETGSKWVSQSRKSQFLRHSHPLLSWHDDDDMVNGAINFPKRNLKHIHAHDERNPSNMYDMIRNLNVGCLFVKNEKCYDNVEFQFEDGWHEEQDWKFIRNLFLTRSNSVRWFIFKYQIFKFVFFCSLKRLFKDIYFVKLI